MVGIYGVELFILLPLIQRIPASLLFHGTICQYRDHLQVWGLIPENRRIGSLWYSKASRQDGHILKQTYTLCKLIRLTLFDKLSDDQRNTESQTSQTLSGKRRTSLRLKHDGDSRTSSLFSEKQLLLHTSCTDRGCWVS